MQKPAQMASQWTRRAADPLKAINSDDGVKPTYVTRLFVPRVRNAEGQDADSLAKTSKGLI